MDEDDVAIVGLVVVGVLQMVFSPRKTIDAVTGGHGWGPAGMRRPRTAEEKALRETYPNCELPLRGASWWGT